MTDPPPLEPVPPGSPDPMPLGVRMLNVFAVPGEVFEDVKRSAPRPGSWLVPALIASVTGVIAALILFSQPAILQEMRDMRAKAMDQQVAEGTLTREQADQAMEVVEKFSTPTVLKISGSVGGILVAVVRIFWWAFALWLLALVFLRARVPYLKALEVTGLASLIGTLGTLVTLLLQVNLGRSTASPSLALAVSDFDPGNKLHMVMGALNLVQVWMVLVMGLGLARLANVPFARASLLVVAFYLLQTSALVLMGAGLAAL